MHIRSLFVFFQSRLSLKLGSIWLIHGSEITFWSSPNSRACNWLQLLNMYVYVVFAQALIHSRKTFSINALAPITFDLKLPIWWRRFTRPFKSCSLVSEIGLKKKVLDSDWLRFMSCTYCLLLESFLCTKKCRFEVNYEVVREGVEIGHCQN